MAGALYKIKLERTNEEELQRMNPSLQTPQLQLSRGILAKPTLPPGLPPALSQALPPPLPVKPTLREANPHLPVKVAPIPVTSVIKNPTFTVVPSPSSEGILINDPTILQFFNENAIDARRFILDAIQKSQQKDTCATVLVQDLKQMAAEQQSALELKQELMEYNKKIGKLLSDMSFHESDRVLSRHFTLETDGTILLCDICNTFRVPTKKGLAAHKRKCGKKVED